MTQASTSHSARTRRAHARPRATDRACEHATPRGRVLGDYVDWRGERRQLVARPGSGGSVLVLDCDATCRDDRLVAHLAPDEPAENAEIASRCFIADARRRRCRCRAVNEADLCSVPLFGERPAVRERSLGESVSPDSLMRDAAGRRYLIEPFATGRTIPELRWCRLDRSGTGSCPEREVISMREAVASLERYEPIRARTIHAVSEHCDDSAVSVAVLRAELVRVNESVIVLNRGIREAVLTALEREERLSMSEIAMRCGRRKRDAAGNVSGETSWLARRLGLLAEGGYDTPTRWVHSDVLALIARDGLGVSPREVEVL